MGGNQGGQPMTERESSQTNGGRGTRAGSNSDWNPDQAGQVKDVEEQGQSIGNRHRTPTCLLYTSPSPRDRTRSRMPSSA